MMAGVSKTPIAAAVLLTEMVGGFIVLIPLMIASIISYLVSGKYTLYESQITSGRMGVDFSSLGEVKIEDVMTKDPYYAPSTMPLEQVWEEVQGHPHHIYPVVQDAQVVGVITRDDIVEGRDKHLAVSDIMRTDFHSIESTSPATDAFEMMTSKRLAAIVVVDSFKSKRLAGIVTRIERVQCHGAHGRKASCFLKDDTKSINTGDTIRSQKYRVKLPAGDHRSIHALK